jgi:hypothetical protein
MGVSHPITADLEALYRFDEASATDDAVDASGNSRTLVQYSSPPAIAGKIDGARDIGDGTGSKRFQSDSNPDDFHLQVFTWCGWIFVPSSGAPLSRPAVEVQRGVGTWSYYLSTHGASYNYGGGVYFTDATSETHSSGLPSLSQGAWHHIGMTWSGTTLTTYHDGAVVKQTVPGAKTIDYTSGWKLRLGNGSSGGNPIAGALDDWAFYSTAKDLEWFQKAHAQQHGDTVETALALQTGVQPRYFCKIEGIKDVLWDVRDHRGPAGEEVGCDPPGGHPLTPNTVGKWPMDEYATDADAADVTGNGLTGTANGSPAVQTGQMGNARGPFSSSAYFTIAYDRLLEPQRVTLAAWVYHTGGSQAQYGKIFYKVHAATVYQSYALMCNTADRKISWVLEMTDSSTATATTTDEIPDLTWVHIIGTWDGTTARLYLNGVLEDSDVPTGDTIKYDQSAAWIGRDAVTSGQFWNGWIDEVGLDNVARSAEWCRRAYLSGRDWSRPGLRCLHLPEQELSSGIDLRTMKVDVSGMQIEVSNVLDPGDKSRPAKRYFAKLFAPGRTAASDVQKTTMRRITAGDNQIGADETTIYCQRNSHFPTSGEADIARERFSYTGVGTPTQTGFPAGNNQTIASFTGCTRGLYPAITTANQGRTYPYPRQVDISKGEVGNFQVIASEPYSMIGREIGIYATVWDRRTGYYYRESDAVLVWPGQITEDITYDPDGDRWSFTAEHILKRLDREVMRHAPKGYVHLINLNGDFGRKWKIAEFDGNGNLAAVGVFEIAKNYYTLDSLQNAIADEIMDSTNWSAFPTYTHLKWKVWFAEQDNGHVNYAAHSGDTSSAKWTWVWLPWDTQAATPQEPHPCHALQALGWNVEDSWRQESSNDQAAGRPHYHRSQLPNEAYHHYHPIKREYNNNKIRIYWEGNDELWDTQGDTSSDTAWFIVRKQPVQGRGTKGIYADAYTARSAVAADPPAFEFTLLLQGGVNHPTGAKRIASGFIGSADPDLPIEVQQCYVPASGEHLTGDQARRGPIEQWLYTLLSTGGQTGYNDATYDQCPLPLSVGFPAELVDKDSFLKWDAMAIAAYADLSRRGFYLIEKSISWQKGWLREALLWGLVAVWDRGKLRCKSLVYPETHHVGNAITLSNRARDEYSPAQMNMSTVTNQWEVHALHDLVANKDRFVGTFNDPESQQGLDAVKKAILKHPGLYPWGDQAEAVLIEKLVKLLVADRWWLQRFPHQRVQVSLAPKEFNQFAPADTIPFTSDWHPDPHGSGLMSVTAIKGMVLNYQWSLLNHAGAAEVLLFSVPTLPKPWAAAALVDITATNGGWDATNKRLTLKALLFGESGDSDDGADFLAGEKVDVIESAPEDPTSPQSWRNQLLDSDYETDGAGLLSFDSGVTLSGWDPDKEYFVVVAAYDNVIAAQKTRNTFQASPSTHLLNGADDADLWG